MARLGIHTIKHLEARLMTDRGEQEIRTELARIHAELHAMRQTSARARIRHGWLLEGLSAHRCLRLLGGREHPRQRWCV